MRTIWIKLNEIKGEVQAEVLVPVNSIIYVLMEYDPHRSSPLSPDYDPLHPWGYAVHIFCVGNKRFGELFATREAAIERVKDIQAAIEDSEEDDSRDMLTN